MVSSCTFRRTRAAHSLSFREENVRTGREAGTPSDTGAPRAASPEELFLAHVALLEEVARFLARRYGLTAADGDDLASRLKVKLLENDYEVLRRFQGKSSLRTYLTVVAQRLFLDARVAEAGRWRPSAEAKRLGPAAERLETLLSRDGLSLEEAIQVLRTNERVGESAEALRALAQRLPSRARRRFVGEEAVAAFPSPGGAADARAAAGEDERAARHAREALRAALDGLGAQDRLVLKLRYADSFQIAEIAAALRLPAKPLYKRIERLLVALRDRLSASGVDGARVLELLGRPATDLSAGLSGGGEKGAARPSTGGDGGS
jgi:RNA polymerase sigma factor (sigma-70 family)